MDAKLDFAVDTRFLAEKKNINHLFLMIYPYFKLFRLFQSFCSGD